MILPAPCIVLAGGLGTRLRSVVPDCPHCAWRSWQALVIAMMYLTEYEIGKNDDAYGD